MRDTLRTGFTADATTYTQSNDNLLGGDNGEALGVAGSASLTNINLYLKGIAQRKATIQATGGVGAGNNGGRLLIFTKDDTSAGADVVPAGYFDFSTGGAGGGFVMGAPTGGGKGAGTINVAGDIYKNNSAYTNPDYVFEHWATGSIDRFRHNDGAADYAGLMPLRDLEAHVRKQFRFPTISDEPMPAFARADVALALIEQNTLYLFEHDAQIVALRAEVSELKARLAAA